MGKDPLDIQVLFDRMINLMHPHRANIPTISGIDIALWDIVGQDFRSPNIKATFRQIQRRSSFIYQHRHKFARQIGMFRMVQKLKESPEGWHTIKLGFEGILNHKSPKRELSMGRPSQMMTATELNLIRQGFENCREALGNDIDFIVHCHNEWDLPVQ